MEKMKILKTFEGFNKLPFIMSDDELWEMIESFNWVSDHDYERIQKIIDKLPKNTYDQLKDFYDQKDSELYSKFEEDWLGDPGIQVSDDGWSDLIAEVIGRGKDFYNNITVEKLQDMAIHNDYTENFGYSFQGKHWD
jgi:hypothetical protein